jgi:hypothetical protein
LGVVQVAASRWPILNTGSTPITVTPGRAKSFSAKHFSESISPMTKRQLIDDIRRFNVSVQPQFLAQFDDAALKQYLDHLQAASLKHVRIAGWVRKQPKLRLVG